MNETVKSIIDGVTRNFATPQVVAGHHVAKEFFDCALLLPSDVARLAAAAVGHLPADTFDGVVSIAYTGLLFGVSVAGGHQVNVFRHDRQIYGPPLSGKKVLIVDDVISTGASVQTAENKAAALGATVVGYCCIVDRSSGLIGFGKMPIYSAYQLALSTSA
jgi:orotate phosphoribosyltransferase